MASTEWTRPPWILRRSQGLRRKRKADSSLSLSVSSVSVVGSSVLALVFSQLYVLGRFPWIFSLLSTPSSLSTVDFSLFFLWSPRFQLWRPLRFCCLRLVRLGSFAARFGIVDCLSATLLGTPEYSAAVGPEASCCRPVSSEAAGSAWTVHSA